jgi:ABC-type glycerol-3-phosphate transport system substrate-binding protein
MLEGVTVGGKLYAAPLMASWTIVYYDSAMLEEAGLDPDKPPRTWDELLAYGRRLQRPTTYAIADSLGPGECVNAFFRWARSAGAKISELRDGRVYWLLDSPECVRALQFLQEMMQGGTMDPGSPTYLRQQTADLFAQGQSAMVVDWDTRQPAFGDSDRILQAPLPGFRPGLSGSIEGHGYLAVPAFSRYKAAAKQFIKYLQSSFVQKKRALEDGQTPVLKALFKDAEVKKAINVGLELEAAANCYYRPAVPEYARCSEAISAEVQNALVNNKDPREALQDAEARCNELSGW